MGLLRQHQLLPRNWYERQLLAFYNEQFELSGLGRMQESNLAADLLLQKATEDLERRRNIYLVRFRLYQKWRIQEKVGGRRIGSLLAVPSHGFLPDEWLPHSQVA